MFSGMATEIVEAFLVIDYNYKFRRLWPEDKFRFIWFPESISESSSPNWEETEAIGRSEPYLGYSSTSANEISLEIQLQAQNDCYEDVVKWGRWFKSMEYPIYKGGVTYPPPTLIFV